MTVKAASEALEWSTPKIWRIESGVTSMRSLDVEAMCRIYGASSKMTEALTGLAKETKARGWWHSYGDAIPEWFELYVGLEAAASELRTYEPQLVPGLLQTRAYATEVYRVARPDLSAAERERGVAVRLGRQAILTRYAPPAPRLDVVLDESVLRRPLPDGPQMSEQLYQINETGRQPNVTVRVLPFGAGVHRAEMANGAFTILDFPESGTGRHTEPTIVYSDGLTGALYLDKPQEVEAYAAVWASVKAACLTEAQSRKLIASIAEEYASS